MSNAIRYELTRLATVRSTWVLLAVGLALQGFIAYLSASRDYATPAEQFVASIHGLPLVLAALFATAVAVNAFGHEYRYGTITTTMLTVRRPGRVMAAKALTVGGLSALYGAALVGITVLVQGLVSTMPREMSHTVWAFAAVPVYVTLAALSGLGVAALTRNATVAMVAAVAFPTVVEVGGVLAGLSSKLMPFLSAGQAVQPGTGNPVLLMLPLFALTAGLLSAGVVLLARRDV
ncbi:ABC transporter permease [Nocardia sp. CDC160]|uniref:ABC transporter permease n=1 Tax=Nocardia sp. CDC160 TaxID=3112166 RepID=UPI002DB9982B|nr:ABC transporter permease [Nocardia sp. CDC160]MEC3918341.1 ABC transporter permease [Nocardia sp. CDC160]